MIPVTQKPANPRSAVARPKTGITPVRTLRVSDPDWDDLHALTGRKLPSVVVQLIRWYLRRPGAKLPERPAVDRIAEIVQERESGPKS